MTYGFGLEKSVKKNWHASIRNGIVFNELSLESVEESWTYIYVEEYFHQQYSWISLDYLIHSRGSLEDFQSKELNLHKLSVS